MIRPAEITDIERVTEIYNEAVIHTVATFDTVPKTVEQQRSWFYQHGTRHPVLVYVINYHIVGWASLNPYSDRPAYDLTAEISLYITENQRGKGVGRVLLEEIVQAGKAAGLHTILARITEGNEISIHLHKSLGFVEVGTMREVGRKFDRLLDVHILQKIL